MPPPECCFPGLLCVPITSPPSMALYGNSLALRALGGWWWGVQGPGIGTDVPFLVLQFSRGQEQHWWIGLHTYENDGRFK